jgi:hypothetical protein
MWFYLLVGSITITPSKTHNIVSFEMMATYRAPHVARIYISFLHASKWFYLSM